MGGLGAPPSSNQFSSGIVIAGGSITTTSNGDLTLLPNGTGITVVGDAGSTSNSLAANDDLFVSGKLEVDGLVYLDGTILIPDGVPLCFGRGTTTTSRIMTSNTNEQILFAIDDLQGRNLIVTDYVNRVKAHGHAESTNPTLWVHSVQDPTGAGANEWVGIRHNQTDGECLCGEGGLIVSCPASAATLTGNSQYSPHFDRAGGNLVFTIKDDLGNDETVTLAKD